MPKLVGAEESRGAFPWNIWRPASYKSKPTRLYQSTPVPEKEEQELKMAFKEWRPGQRKARFHGWGGNEDG